MLAVYLLLVGVGYAVGAVHTSAIRWAREHRQLPPATPRAIARAARRNRADLRHVRPAREQGVHVGARAKVVVPVVARREYELPRLSEPPSFLADVEDFDEKGTQP